MPVIAHLALAASGPVKSADAHSQNELLAALCSRAGSPVPGAGAKAAFESPKVAAHGDACTAAMQLTKPLKLNPLRALGEQLKVMLEATPAFSALGVRH